MKGSGTTNERTRVASCLLLLATITEWSYFTGLILLVILNRLLNRAPIWLLAPNTFLFYWFIPLLPLAAYSLIRRRTLRHLPSLLASALFLLLFGGQLIPQITSNEDGDSLLVMTYNIKREAGGTAPLLAVIGGYCPQVLALQEASQPDDSRSDLISQLEDTLGYSCSYRSYYAATQSAGVAVCVQPPLQLYNVQRRTYHKLGRWSYLFAEMDVNGETVNIIVPHLLAFRISTTDPVNAPRYTLHRLRWAAGWHHREANELLRLISGFHDPTIMAGDFNSTPQQSIHIRIRKSLRDAFRESGFGLGSTYRYGLPIRIDYIYLSPELTPIATEVGPWGPSDHRPVIARVRLAKSTPSS
jgi:endonuclease/exonuclease/phosphatase (EEP) superfamily protein YafD